MTARIALVHAVAVAIDPIREAFAELWPQARTFNLLDDALSPDREAADRLSEALTGRIVALARYARSAGAQGILYTCSAFGPAIERAQREVDVPVLKPNEAMFAEALARGKRIAMLATFQPSVASMVDEFEAMAGARGLSARLDTLCVPEAMQALRAGDRAAHDALLAQAAVRLDGCDALMLAHFSTSRALASVSAAVGATVLTAPRCAVAALRASLRDSPRD